MSQTDAELQEQISDPFYAKATMNVALADEGDSWTISKKDFNAYTLQLVEMTKARDAAVRIETAMHVKDICPVTEGWSVERLHNRIDTYIGQLRRESDLLRHKENKGE